VVKNNEITINPPNMKKPTLRIQNMCFGNGNWVALLHPSKESVTEECYSASNITQLWNQIGSSYNQGGRRVHQITYGDKMFHLIMREGNEEEQCIAGSSLSDLLKQVNVLYEKQLRCHLITHGNNTWIAVMKKKNPIVAEQCVIASSITDLMEKVKQQYNQKLRIHHITYACDTWVAIMREEDSDEQCVVANSLSELYSKIEEQHKKGRRIYSLCFGENVWVGEKVWIAVAKKSDVDEKIVCVTNLPELWNRVQKYYDGSY
jgi:hypothetical protein